MKKKGKKSIKIYLLRRERERNLMALEDQDVKSDYEEEEESEEDDY